MRHDITLHALLSTDADLSALSDKALRLRETYLSTKDPIAMLKLIGYAMRGTEGLFDIDGGKQALPAVYDAVADLAKHGNTEAALTLSMVHGYMTPFLLRDPKKEIEWLEIRAHTDKETHRILAREYATPNSGHHDPERARYHERKAEEAGVPVRKPTPVNASNIIKAHNALRDSAEAQAYFHAVKEAAALGIPESVYRLGYCYWDGFGTERDFIAAEPYLLAAAERGHARACMILASIYSGVLEKSLKDRDKQHYWYERAAERGVTDALAPLAEHYARAIGTERDLDRANTLLERYYRERHALAVQARARQAAEEIATELGVKLPPSLR